MIHFGFFLKRAEADLVDDPPNTVTVAAAEDGLHGIIIQHFL